MDISGNGIVLHSKALRELLSKALNAWVFSGSTEVEVINFIAKDDAPNGEYLLLLSAPEKKGE